MAILLVGNKCDLHQLRAISVDEAQAYCGKHGLAYIETSAKDASNVAAAFQQLVADIFRQVATPVITSDV